ncbi:MAG: hypothetical protein L6R41_001053 [Letrouitia leprolyta]|nr:MAG: hypothetical protein L6R41_001053 [Letrouitia leprolyta]
MSPKDNPNRFGVLAMDVDDGSMPVQSTPEQVPASASGVSTDAGSNLQGLTDLARALPSTQEATQPPVAGQGTKRSGSPVEPVGRYSKAAFQKARKEAQEKSAAKALQQATSGTPQPTMAQVVERSKTKEEDDTPKPFPFREIVDPVGMGCSLSINGVPALGEYAKDIPNLGLRFVVDAGKFGDPKLCLVLALRISGPGEEEVIERCRINWRPGTKTGSAYDISDLEEMSRDQWGISTPGAATIYNSRTEVVELGDQFRTLKFFARGGTTLPAKNFNANLIRLCPSWVMNFYNTITNGECELRFFYTSTKRYDASAMPQFLRCYNERLEPFHQYRKDGTGPYNLYSLKVPFVNEVGNGMYNRPNKTFQELPVLDEYTRDEFLMTSALTSIREGQFHQSRGIGLALVPRDCYVYQPPMFFDKKATGAGEEISVAKRSFDDWVLVFVRLPAQAKVDWIPDLGTTVLVEWPEVSTVFRTITWTGKSKSSVVVKVDQADLAATRTDFCLCMNLPAGTGPKRHRTLDNLENLAQARLEVKSNVRPNLRELAGTNNIWTSKREEHLDFLRCMSQPSRPAEGPGSSTIDLGEGNCHEMPDSPEKRKQIEWNKEYFSEVVEQIKRVLDNPSQAKVLDGLRRIADHHMAIAGPSGTGKTNVIQRIAWLLVAVGHKLAICCPSNTALDHVFKKIWNARPEEFAKVHMLRMEIYSIEKEIFLRKLSDQSTTNTRLLPQDIDDSGEADKDVLIQTAWQFLIAQHADDEAKFAQFEEYIAGLAKLQDASAETKKEFSTFRATEIPYEITLGYHIRRICAEDVANAQREYDLEKQRTPVTEHGDLATVQDRCASFPYTEWHNYFVQREGRLNKEQSLVWLGVRTEMLRRVFKSITQLGVTLNNAGHEFLELGFDASVLIVDEAGQASFPSMFVPMMAFKKWIALLMFGDPQQLTPTIMARFFSEVAQRSKVSPLQVAWNSKRNLFLLTDQYRMAEAIHQFVSEHFYANELVCHPMAKVDNPIREQVRQVSKLYGIKGNGSEYFLLDVVKGCARVEPQGTSLVNYANADAIVDLVDNYIKAGIPPERIVILSMYKAQIKLLALKITRLPDGRLKYAVISTTDAFQGRESEVVILDIVIAKDFGEHGYLPSNMRHGEDQDDADVLLTAQARKYGDITAFARDFHRQCVALTRAKDGLVIVGQLARMISSHRKSTNPLHNTLFHIAQDARKRKLVATDLVHVDTHPDVAKEQKARGQQQQDLASEAARASFISSYEHWHRSNKSQQEAKAKAKTSSAAVPDTQNAPSGRVPLPHEMQQKKQGKGHKNRRQGKPQQKPDPKPKAQDSPVKIKEEPKEDDTTMG